MPLNDQIAAADALADSLGEYRAIDLSRLLADGIPTYPTHPKYFQMKWCSMGDPAEMNQLVLGEHTGTHVDAPSHFVPALDDPARRHVHELPLERFYGRALKMTFGPFAPGNAVVTLADVRAWEKTHLPVRSGDVVLVDFQWGGRWQPGPGGFAFLDRWPGLARDAAEYLVERGVKLVGTDCISLDPGDGGGGMLPAHYTLLPRGVLILENVANLALLPPVSVFMALPLHIYGGTGSPVRAVAFVKRV